MKIVRLLPLALLAASLAACGADRLTGPDADTRANVSESSIAPGGNGGFGSGN